KSKLGLVALDALDVFRLGRDLLVEMRAHPAAVPLVDAEVERVLLAVAEGHHQFARAAKLSAFAELTA
ncbi:MAG: hypothetical protein KC620_21395, partial [Myxococcales bacterium]|nr:hypothetical protein [Myxococcales bacterium]